MPPLSVDPVVLTITHPLTHQTAAEVAAQIGRVPPTAPVVIDLTAVPAFDSDGADLLLQLQERLGADRLSIVGFRQAAARIVGGSDDLLASVPAPEQPARDGWSVRRLRNLAIVHGAEGAVLSAEALEPAVVEAVAQDVAIVVIDLRPVSELTAKAVQTIAFASSEAALRGQELLVVNVSTGAAELLRRAGMSATTFIAPQPRLDDR